MGYMKHLAIQIANTRPVTCDCGGNLYILEEDGVMWCDRCGFADYVKERQ